MLFLDKLKVNEVRTRHNLEVTGNSCAVVGFVRRVQHLDVEIRHVRSGFNNPPAGDLLLSLWLIKRFDDF